MGEIFGDYELIEKIATGGMAEIYLARLSGVAGFSRAVVVKKMLPELAVREDFVTMFLDEARLAANLAHPNIVQVFNLGETDGGYFMAMELIDGPHLGALFAHSLRERNPLPLPLCVYAVARSADGLHYAHDLVDPSTGQPMNIVHRDISPQNILVSKQGDVKVTDFGVAKASTQEAKTRTGVIKGKVAYMSPEQCLGELVDRRTDVFALGIMLYELLTRRRLFREKSDLLIMQRITTEKVKPPSELNPEVDAELDDICRRALAINRDDRFDSAGDLAEALDVWSALNGHADSRGQLTRWIEQYAPKLGLDTSAIDQETQATPAQAVAAMMAQGGELSAGPVSASDTEKSAAELSKTDLRKTGPELDSDVRRENVDRLIGGLMDEKTPPEISRPWETLTQEGGDAEGAGNSALDLVAGSGSADVAEQTVSSFSQESAAASARQSKSNLRVAAMGGFGLLVGIGLLSILFGGDKKTVLPPPKTVAVLPTRTPVTLSPDVVTPVPGPNGGNDGGPQVGVKLTIETEPSAVPILVDGKPRGNSPVTVLVTGTSAVEARFANGAVARSIVLGKTGEKFITLLAKVPLVVTTSPPSAQIRIAGRLLGESPIRVEDRRYVTPGHEITVAVSLAGYKTEQHRVRPESGKPFVLDVSLKKVAGPVRKPVVRKAGYGQVQVFSRPWVNVKLAGKNLKATPFMQPKRVRSGRQIMRVSNPQFGIAQTFAVNVPRDGVVKVKLTFAKQGEKYVLKKKSISYR